MNSRSNVNQLNEKNSKLNGAATTIVLSMSNNYFALFAISVLGATNYQVGLISSLPQIVGMIAMVLGTILMGRLEEKKKFTSFSFLFTRIFLLGMFMVLYLPEDYRAWVFVILVGLMNLPGSFANLSWQSFIGDLVPDSRRSGFFSERNRVLTIAGMITTLLIGLALQMFHPSNPVPYQALFILAFMFGLIEVYFLNRHIEVKKQKAIEKKKLHFGWDAYKHKPFIYFLIAGLFFNFGWQMAWPLFNIYNINVAHATGFWISLFTVGNQIGQVMSFKWWGKMADKYSNAKMLAVCAVGMAVAPTMNILSTNLIYLTMVNVFSGVFVAGTILLLFNQLLEVTKEDNRSSCISQYNILLAIVGFVAPQVGVFLLEQTSMNIAMNTSSLLRLASGAVFLVFYVYVRKQKVLQRNGGQPV
ncbi:Major Facilitator Superfamily protein [Mesobacillus persicus]|uniref:Major Facilitator Superfamily protein n=1 Tax=Mesobacillus persicus TaxID=930146 RepID=A0A1H7ZB66_9BACI|nr:MFS transporter [Mesobacillus persicus]SEM55660.1 Major Facilitator Superfamily protein [Mesobacillus persicus]